jgi:hypothetical protein
MKLRALGENGERHKLERILASFRPTPKKLHPKSPSWRAWNGQKPISRCCPFN